MSDYMIDSKFLDRIEKVFTWACKIAIYGFFEKKATQYWMIALQMTGPASTKEGNLILMVMDTEHDCCML